MVSLSDVTSSRAWPAFPHAGDTGRALRPACKAPNIIGKRYVQGTPVDEGLIPYFRLSVKEYFLGS